MRRTDLSFFNIVGDIYFILGMKARLRNEKQYHVLSEFIEILTAFTIVS